MKLSHGQRYGQWTLVGDEEIGKGGNGIVWLAENPEGTKGAIKFFNRDDLKKRFDNRPEEIAKRETRFHEEIDFLTREGNRPGILPLIDSHSSYPSSDAGLLWFVTPFAERFPKLPGSENLCELVSKFQIIATTLAGLHAEKTWHRDIHPGNLFLLNGSPVIGDFGLVDYPDKAAITGKDERIGAEHYVAPELRRNAGHTPADKADVYSLAKSFWVLATGEAIPRFDQPQLDNPSLKVSTYCRHKYAYSLDVLMHNSTEYEPDRRPAMESFARELSEWLKIGTASSPVNLDSSTLAKEFQGVFEPRIAAERNKENFLKEAGSVSMAFNTAFDLMQKQIAQVTGLTPTRGHTNYQNNTGFQEVFQGASVISKYSSEVNVALKIGPTEICFNGCVLFEVLNDKRMHITAGYTTFPLFHHPAFGRVRMVADETHTWKKEIVALVGSAQLTNEVEALKKELLENLPQAIRAFAERVRPFQQS
jgi:serine/threonine protein kinase